MNQANDATSEIQGCFCGGGCCCAEGVCFCPQPCPCGEGCGPAGGDAANG